MGPDSSHRDPRSDGNLRPRCGGAAANRFSQVARECAPGPEGRPNRSEAGRGPPGVMIQPKGMTAHCRCAGSYARNPSDLQFWSPRSDSNRRPSDYESVPNPPTGPAQTHPGCSGAGPIPSRPVLWCLVAAPGLPQRLPPCCVKPQHGCITPAPRASDGNRMLVSPATGCGNGRPESRPLLSSETWSGSIRPRVGRCHHSGLLAQSW